MANIETLSTIQKGEGSDAFLLLRKGKFKIVMWPFRKQMQKNNNKINQSIQQETKHDQRPAPSTTDSPFEVIEGRVHVTDAPYLLPKDGEEIDRLDFQHYILRSIIKGNVLAPIKEPKTILDVGCGTGRWSSEVAHIFPQSYVAGVDLVVPQPRGNQPFPANCHFMQGNVLEGLPFPDRSFDFVHQRLLVFAIPADRWVPEVQELARVAHSGSWIELVEIDIAFEQMGPASTQLAEWATQVSRRRGIDPTRARHIGDIMRQAGLTNVVSQQVKNPVGNWGGRVGTMAATGVQAVNRAVRQQVIAQLGISPADFDRELTASANEYDRYQSFSYSYVAYGQRP
jgi:ubiquinone/menaquinone biosynthesis C-methylase UbiE